MKLWIVSQWWEHGGHSEAMGAYTSPELAAAAIAQYRATSPSNLNANFEIVERMVDAPMAD